MVRVSRVTLTLKLIDPDGGEAVREMKGTMRTNGRRTVFVFDETEAGILRGVLSVQGECASAPGQGGKSRAARPVS